MDMCTNDRTMCTNDKTGPFPPADWVMRRLGVAGWRAATKLAAAGWKPGQIPANFALAGFPPAFWQEFVPFWRTRRRILVVGD